MSLAVVYDFAVTATFFHKQCGTPYGIPTLSVKTIGLVWRAGPGWESASRDAASAVACSTTCAD